jgi:hypothetical protein
LIGGKRPARQAKLRSSDFARRPADFLSWPNSHSSRKLNQADSQPVRFAILGAHVKKSSASKGPSFAAWVSG